MAGSGRSCDCLLERRERILRSKGSPSTLTQAPKHPPAEERLTALRRRVTVRRCHSVMEAETVRIRLEAAGIHAIILGAEAGVALSYFGGAVGYPQVEVPAEDFERASELLQADQQVLRQAQPWSCARCDEPNEAAFEFCWSCNKSRDAADPIIAADEADDARHAASATIPSTKRLIALLCRLFPAARVERADRRPSRPDSPDGDRG